MLASVSFNLLQLPIFILMVPKMRPRLCFHAIHHLKTFEKDFFGVFIHISMDGTELQVFEMRSPFHGLPRSTTALVNRIATLLFIRLHDIHG